MRRQAMTRRALSGLALATVAGALAAPSTGMAGVAAIQDDALTTVPVDQIPARITLLQQTQAKVARVDVLWSKVAPTPPANPTDPNDPAYDFSRLDLIFSSLANAGITPIVSTYSTPDWAIKGRNVPHLTEYNPSAPRPGAFGQFMQALALRYSGFFVPTGAPVPLPRVRHFEIWNEPNLRSFFSVNGRSTLAGYKALVKAAYPQIKLANPGAIVIAGVGGPRSSTGNGNVGARTWLEGLVNDKSVKFNAYSQHIYPSRGPKFSSKSYDKAFPTWNSLDEIYATLDTKRPGMKLYVTEAGYTTASTSFRLVRVSFGQQKLFLQQLFSLPAVKSPRLAAVVWFNMQDNFNWPGGLMTAAGLSKPSFAAFRTIAARPIPAALRGELRR